VPILPLSLASVFASLAALAGPAHDTTHTDGTSVLAEAAPELGDVAWTRGLDAAKARSRTSGKPVLVLFDEVPGCATVNAFAAGPLSHPLLVEAAETLFEPVLVYNNRSEDDAICEAWGEPRWNNPVLRSIDADGHERAHRFAGPYTEAATARFLTSALGDAAPPWLSDLADELEARGRAQTATYAMACFWSGEAHLGQADGVLATRTGWQGGQEVVEVIYDPHTVDAATLDAFARAGRSQPAAAGSLAPTPKDDRHALKRTKWASVWMTPRQATRANALAAAGGEPSSVLSPRQQAAAGD